MDNLIPADYIRFWIIEGIAKGFTAVQAFDFLCLRWEREHGRDPEWPSALHPPGAPLVRLPRLQ